LVKHWEARLEAMDGKAMIVCMSRRICVELYKPSASCAPRASASRTTTSKPRQGRDENRHDRLGAEDGPDWQPHISQQG
jgi:type I restriction enzyme R subunit